MLSTNITAPISQKDKEFVERMFEEYHRLMLFIANRILNDYSLSEDVVADSFIKIIRHKDKLQCLPSFHVKAYIVNIVTTTAYNNAKQRGRHIHEPEHLLDELPDENINILDNLVSQEGFMALEQAILVPCKVQNSNKLDIRSTRW